MTSAEILPTTLMGLGTGLSLIVAIGAQNAFILRQGIIGKFVAPIVLFCIIGDVLLIGAGVWSVGQLAHGFTWVLEALGWFGGAFLIWYGFSAARRALQPEALTVNPSTQGPATLGKALTTTFAITYLNPHVYLDTFVLLGSLANTHGVEGRWWFYLGCVLGSVLWFTALGYGSRFLRPIFAKPRAWRVLDGCIALLMFFLAYQVMFG